MVRINILLFTITQINNCFSIKFNTNVKFSIGQTKTLRVARALERKNIENK